MGKSSLSSRSSLMRCRVEATAIGREWSVRLGPGLIVDLATPVAPGVALRDVVDETWFEPVTAGPPPEPVEE